MFACGLCGIQSESKEKGVKVILEKKMMDHFDAYGNRIGQGFQIAREVTAHAACALQVQKESQRLVTDYPRR